MYRRHDDRCPTCRAARDVGASDTQHGGRSAGTPVHLQSTEPGVVFFPIDNSQRVVSGASISVLHVGELEEDYAANVMSGWINVINGLETTAPHAAAESDERVPEHPEAESVIQQDPRTVAAMSGLRNVATIPLEQFRGSVYAPIVRRVSRHRALTGLWHGRV
jgi:hypothetical protein